MCSRWTLFFALAGVLGCQRPAVQSAPPAAPALESKPGAKLSVAPAEIHPTATAANKAVLLPVCDSGGLDPLSAARKSYDEGRFEQALSCAAQAAALRPDEPQAHSERAAALTALSRHEEARMAYARALALDSDHLDALLGAAHLYVVTLPSTRERDELGSVYAEHGLALAEEQGDQKLVAEFALMSAMAFNDLGQAREALDRAEKVRRLEPRNKEALYERAVALFELCRFSDAKTAFVALVEDKEHSAHAHQHLGLLLEREGNYKEAEKHFAKARALAPEDFPEPQMLPEVAFKTEVDRAVHSLPGDMRQDLSGVPVATEELPQEADLLSGDQPLSPAILGLYRGPPLSEACTAEDGVPCRSVVLYRRNLGRAVKSRDELIEQIRVTLLHEVGHLRGEDDFELAARGLE